MHAEKLTVTDLARHFWSAQAAQYIREKEVDIAEIDKFGGVVPEASSWIESTLDKGILSPDLAGKAESIILAYPTARMFISIIGNEYLLRKFANAVSKYAGVMLENEDDAKVHLLATTPGNLSEKPWQLTYEKSTLDRKTLIGGRIFEWRLFFTDYIAVAQGFHDDYWKLVNRTLNRGWVYLLRSDVIRLMEEALKTRISRSGLKPGRELPPAESLPENMREVVERISLKVKKKMSELQPFGIEGMGLGEKAYPGCIRQIIEKLDKGIGVSHNERLALVFFLSNIGMSADEILQAFSKSPDFDPERSRYYVEHAMGLRGGGTKYKSFACPKLRTFGICHPQDEWCVSGKLWGKPLRGPINFYQAKSWALTRSQESKKPAKPVRTNEE